MCFGITGGEYDDLEHFFEYLCVFALKVHEILVPI